MIFIRSFNPKHFWICNFLDFICNYRAGSLLKQFRLSTQIKGSHSSLGQLLRWSHLLPSHYRMAPYHIQLQSRFSKGQRSGLQKQLIQKVGYRGAQDNGHICVEPADGQE